MMLGKPPYKYCFLIGQTLVMSSLHETCIGDVITLCFLVLKCLHQFSCSSYKNKARQVPSLYNSINLPLGPFVAILLTVSSDVIFYCLETLK